MREGESRITGYDSTQNTVLVYNMLFGWIMDLAIKTIPDNYHVISLLYEPNYTSMQICFQEYAFC